MKTYAFLTSLFPSGALAQSAVADCHREKSPDWKDCDSLWNTLGWTAGSPREVTRNCGRDTDSKSGCLRIFGKDRDVAFTKVIDPDDGKVEKRDGKWINLVTRQGVIKPGERKRVNANERAPGIDIEVGATAGVSAGLFNIVEASVQISTSYTESFSACSSHKYSSGKCPNNANVYYALVYTTYEGKISHRDGVYTIWVVQNVNGVLEGRSVVERVGTTPA
ncbi:hypothetical protein ACHAPO_011463 [Fusarium lateritium]